MNPFSSAITTLGQTKGRDQPQTFGIKQSDRFSHVYLVGKTGVGKSTLIAGMALSDIAAGRGLCLLDPHGDLASSISQQTKEPHIMWRPGDPDCPYGYNILANVPPAYHSLVTSGIIEILKNQWADAWGVRMEHILRYTLLALLETGSHSFADIPRMLRNKSFRLQIIAQLVDDDLKSFWKDEFKQYSLKATADGIAPILNKFGAFLANPHVRKALCEPTKPLRFGQMMQNSEAVLVDLDIGRLGRDISSIVGGLITTVVTLAAYARGTLSEDKRTPFFLYLDECGNFTTQTLAYAFAEMRKYRVGVVAANQYRNGLATDVREAVLANCGTQIVFRTGIEDAAYFEKSIGPRIKAVDIRNLPNHHFYASVLIDGEPSRVFSACTIRPNGR